MRDGDDETLSHCIVRNDVPYLLDEVERLRRQKDESDAVTERKAGLFDALAAISHEGCTCPKIHPHHFEAILDAVTPDAPVTVETVEEVRGLPEPARVVDRNYNLCAIVRDGYYVAGFAGLRPFSTLPLPATVLTPATPEREAAVERVAGALRSWLLGLGTLTLSQVNDLAPKFARAAIAAYEGRGAS
jgi:hypothetical protein